MIPTPNSPVGVAKSPTWQHLHTPYPSSGDSSNVRPASKFALQEDRMSSLIGEKLNAHAYVLAKPHGAVESNCPYGIAPLAASIDTVSPTDIDACSDLRTGEGELTPLARLTPPVAEDSLLARSSSSVAAYTGVDGHANKTVLPFCKPPAASEVSYIYDRRPSGQLAARTRNHIVYKRIAAAADAVENPRQPESAAASAGNCAVSKTTPTNGKFQTEPVVDIKSARVIDPHGRLDYWWAFVVSTAWLYNFWIIIFRTTFYDPANDTPLLWIVPDYTADLIYMLDIVLRFWTGYLEEGVLVTDPVKLRQHYIHSKRFYFDCIAVAPVDVLYLKMGFKPPIRFLRLLKTHRFFMFLDRTERHTNSPNVIRLFKLALYLLAILHWNACICHLVASCTRAFADVDYLWNAASNHLCVKESLNTTSSLSGDNVTVSAYLHALYWSTLLIIGHHPQPLTTEAYLFTIMEVLLGLLLFATVVGHITQIVASISSDRKEFQGRLDAVKVYMRLRRVPKTLQDRVIKWFDYLWICKRTADEEKVLGLLPEKLRAAIALHVHLETLKSVDFFHNSEEGFLAELVLKLRPVLFSPGDYICKKNEIGKEMYIIAKGKLHVLADDGITVFAVLTSGKYFGEISILNATAGNRRTATVRSVGYSDLFCLSKSNLWSVLKDYPAERARLEAIAAKRLAQFHAHNQQVLCASRENIAAGNGTRRHTRSGSCSSFKPPSVALDSRRHSHVPCTIVEADKEVKQDSEEQNTVTNKTADSNAVTDELQSLRARIQRLESENASLNTRVNSQQALMMRRLQDLELRMRMRNEFESHSLRLSEELLGDDNHGVGGTAVRGRGSCSRSPQEQDFDPDAVPSSRV